MLYANRVELPSLPVFSVVPAKEIKILGIARKLAVVDHIPERHGYRLACLLLIRTGMHINEVIALKVHDMVDGIIRVRKSISKGKVRLTRKAGKPVSYRVTPQSSANTLKDTVHSRWAFSGFFVSCALVQS
jgi:integrase